MTQEIKLSGLSTIPDDYQAPDGSLAVSLNLICEDAHLKALQQPSKICQLPERCRVMFVHKTSAFTNYIIYEVGTNDNILHWVGEEDIHSDSTVQSIISGQSQVVRNYENRTIGKIVSVGNTLEVLADDGVHYSIWKGNEYFYLGTHMPELTLSFGLQGETKETRSRELLGNQVFFKRDHGDISAPALPSPGESVSLRNTEVEIDYLTEQLLALANKFIAEEGTNKGKFVFPFFVRYAYRLYDGNVTMHSVPVLMTTNSHLSPNAFIWHYYDDSADAIIGGLVYDLDYQCIDQAAKDTLLLWSDIIKSVDIFVSAPIYTYNQAGEVDSIINWPASRKGKTKALIPSTEDTMHRSHTCANIIFKDITGHDYQDPGEYVPYWYFGGLEFQLPRHSAEEIFDSVSGCSNFYLLKSIAVAALSMERTIVKFPENYLQSLTSRELMTEDNGSHDTLVPSYMLSLNSRLLMANITKHLAHPLPAAYYTVFYENTNMFNTGVYVFLEKDGVTKVVQSTESQLGSDLPFDFFYYPDPDAYKVQFYHKNGQTMVHQYEVELKKHDFLPGAFCCMTFDPDFRSETVSYLPVVSDDIVVRLHNKVYNSDVNNPFFFPTTGISTVGVGELVGVATVNEPVSQGQFGYADIYLFSSDGLTGSQDGQGGQDRERQSPLARRVLQPRQHHPAQPVRALHDGTRHHAGDRRQARVRLRHADGCPLDLSTLPFIGEIAGTFQPSDFATFLQGCRMLYDYIHQHVVVFNPALDGNTPHFPYAYVFSLRSKLWGMMDSNLASSLNSYPECLAMDQDNNLVSFDNPVTTNPVDGIAITRPIKFGSPDTLKSVYELIQRGVFNRGDVKTILYGSRDLEHWYLIASSTSHAIRGLRGTPYKYFRLVAVSSLADNQSLAGTTFVVEPRHIHQLH